MSKITKMSDLPKATATLLQAVKTRDYTPSEAADVSRMLDAHLKAIETAELAAGLARLEEGR